MVMAAQNQGNDGPYVDGFTLPVMVDEVNSAAIKCCPSCSHLPWSTDVIIYFESASHPNDVRIMRLGSRLVAWFHGFPSRRR